MHHAATIIWNELSYCVQQVPGQFSGYNPVCDCLSKNVPNLHFQYFEKYHFKIQLKINHPLVVDSFTEHNNSYT